MIYNLIINFKKTYNLFVLENWKILKIAIIENTLRVKKLNEEFSSKTKVRFFHLILWAFEIKIKKVKKTSYTFCFSRTLCVEIMGYK